MNERDAQNDFLRTTRHVQISAVQNADSTLHLSTTCFILIVGFSPNVLPGFALPCDHLPALICYTCVSPLSPPHALKPCSPSFLSVPDRLSSLVRFSQRSSVVARVLSVELFRVLT